MKNKDKYNLSHLHIVERAETNILGINMAYVEIEYNGKIVKEYACTNEAGIKKFLEWLEEDDGKECKPTILTDKEKAYLSAVIKPFRKDVVYIEKCIFSMDTDYVMISTKTNENINFPNFGRKSMYIGMKENRRYTLEELGL